MTQINLTCPTCCATPATSAGEWVGAGNGPSIP